jgi:hypothetical protein
MTGQEDASGATKARRQLGIGRVLIAVYAILALAALGRSVFQIGTKFGQAPVAYSLSALAAVVYVVATIALLVNHDVWRVIAWVTLVFELAGVVIVGTFSLIDPALFPHDTVWSVYGRGYLFIPLVLPILGMIWLRKTGKSVE